MTRTRTSIALLAASALLLGAVGCAPSDATDTLSGNVADDIVAVSVPPFAEPIVDLDAGFAGAAGASAAAGSPARSTASTVAAIAGLGAYARIAVVYVREGDRVEAGQPIAQLATAALTADVAAARAKRDALAAQLPVLDDGLDTVDDNRGKLVDARAKIDSAIRQANTARKDLVAKKAELEAVLAKLPPSLPPTLPPGMPTPPDPAKIRAAIAQIDAGIAKIDAGLAKARSGYGTISSARGKLSDAERQIDNARDLLKTAVDAAGTGVRVAQWRLASATVYAPESGTVVSAAQSGDALAPGATIATIRPDAAPRVVTWVTPGQVAAIAPSPASSRRPAEFSVTGDWAGGESFSATLVRVGTGALYPPTSFATREVHLMRGVRIELEVETSATLPAGAPVDISVK